MDNSGNRSGDEHLVQSCELDETLWPFLWGFLIMGQKLACGNQQSAHM